MRIVRLLVAFAALTLAAGAVAAPAGAYPAGTVATAQINANVFAPGSTVVVTVEKTTPGPLTMSIFSAPVVIGTGTAGPDGSGSVSGVIPAGYSGPHTIQVDGAGGEIFPFSITVTGQPIGGFSTNCPIVTGKAAAPAGPLYLSFSGFGFVSGATYSFVANGTTIAAGTADVNGGLGLSGVLDIAAGTDVALSIEDAGGAVVAATTLSDQDPCFILTTSPPPTLPPTLLPTTTGSPSPVGSGTTVTVGVTLPGGDGRDSGDLASTGTQVGLGVGAGLAALLAGGLVLVLSRRRPARHRG